ncbi:hypothetical protein [Paenibacillus ottowii]
MERRYVPYFIVGMSIYFSDGVEEVFIYSFEREDMTKKVCNMLNGAYNKAYQDGLYVSLDENYKELIEHIKFLTFENLRLKRLLNS